MEGLSRSAIARRLGISRNTVAKYADMEDFSLRPQTRYAQCRSRVEPFARVVDAWVACGPVDAEQAAAYRSARV